MWQNELLESLFALLNLLQDQAKLEGLLPGAEVGKAWPGSFPMLSLLFVVFTCFHMYMVSPHVLRSTLQHCVGPDANTWAQYAQLHTIG